MKEIFKECTVKDKRIHPPTQRIDAKDYQALKKIMLNNLGRWKAGKTQAFEFDYDPTELLSKLCEGENVNMKKKFNFFPTPTNVVDKMLQIAMPWTDMKFLEPSAGQGHIYEEIKKFVCVPADVDCIELNPINRGILQEKNIPVIWDDFLTFQPEQLYDGVIANPPFDGYIEHVWKMIECVSEEGSVTTVLPTSITFKKDKKTTELRDYIKEHGQFFDIEDGSFKQSGTGVSTVVAHIIKPIEQKQGLLF